MTKTIKIRKDGWTTEQDELLKDIVIEHIKNGETISRGIEIAAKELNRTMSGCNYRWNHLRKVYFKELSKIKKPLVSAKKQRKAGATIQSEDTTKETKRDTLDSLSTSSFLGSMMDHFDEYTRISKQNEEMRLELIQADEQLDEARMQISLFETKEKDLERLNDYVKELALENEKLKKENLEYKESMEKVLFQAKQSANLHQPERLRLVSE